MKAPEPLAGVGIVGIDEAARSELGAGDTDNHLVLYNQRSRGSAEARLEIVHRGLPQRFAVLGIQRDEFGFKVHFEKFAAKRGEPAVHAAAASLHTFGNGPSVVPQRFSGSEVQRIRMVRGTGEEHQAVEHQRGRFNGCRSGCLENPLRSKPGDVACIHLLQ